MSQGQGGSGCVGAGCLAITALFVVLIVIGILGGEDSTPTETAEKNENRKQVAEPGGAKERPLDEEEKEPKTVAPPPVDPDLAEIYVYGANMEDGEGDYWVEWEDETGAVESARKTGTLPNEDKRVYRADISEAPADGYNQFEVTAYKQTDWEGALSVLLKVGGEWRDCSSTDSSYHAAAGIHLYWTIGSKETAPVCQSHFWFD